jgi:hypothetical protein
VPFLEIDQAKSYLRTARTHSSCLIVIFLNLQLDLAVVTPASYSQWTDERNPY